MRAHPRPFLWLLLLLPLLVMAQTVHAADMATMPAEPVEMDASMHCEGAHCDHHAEQECSSHGGCCMAPLATVVSLTPKLARIPAESLLRPARSSAAPPSPPPRS
ncbi:MULTISPECIES: hypothetical protein [unclassified Thioalkalivibrio]|uniref:hypothetical protein n=1 Tax=unclassified Thioalkalivibrio TaxID=2621013 RepID=UPI000360A926|nr:MULTISPECIES: hypothetical protein [unclassified Thioalkalivibrio]